MIPITNARRHAGVPGLVSVIIATYNCRRYLPDAIKSVLAQTYSRLELHVIDDGSDDGSDQEVGRFLLDRRVHYHYQPNAGQTVAKNHGIARSVGEFVAFCDADDLWLPTKLALELPAFGTDASVGVVYSRAAVVDAQGHRLALDPADEPERPNGWVTSPLFKRNFVPFGTAVIRRRCIEDVGGFDERYRMGIDWELWLRISLRYQFRFVDAETYLYRRWSGQMSTNWRGRYDCAFRIMESFLAQHPSAVPAATVREAWAHSYMQRARLRTFFSGEYLAAVGDVGRALSIKPAYGVAWRTMVAIILAAIGARRM